MIPEVSYLGYKISEEGVKTYPKKLQLFLMLHLLLMYHNYILFLDYCNIIDLFWLVGLTF